MKIEGIEKETAEALIERAKEFHEKDKKDISQKIKELGLADDLINLKRFNSRNACYFRRTKIF